MPLTPRVTRAFNRANAAASTVKREREWSKPWFAAAHAYLSWLTKGLNYYSEDTAENPRYREPLPDYTDILFDLPDGLREFYADTIHEPRLRRGFRK